MRCSAARALAATLFAAALFPGVVQAQDRPFVFSVLTSTKPDQRRTRVDYEFGVGERTFQESTANQPEQRVGVQASLGRLTLLARVGIADTGSAYQSSQAGEILVSILRPSPRFILAAGGGIQHEAGGTDVLLARIVAGRETPGWLTDGNMVFQHPMAVGRDAVDLLTTVGAARRLGSRLAIGVEGVGEDLEAFWDPSEAEGGARILVGPSLHISSASRNWQFTATGGPILHPARNGRSSDALRDLPPDPGRVGYAFRAGLSINVF